MQKYAGLYVKYAEVYLLHISHLYALPTLLMTGIAPVQQHRIGAIIRPAEAAATAPGPSRASVILRRRYTRASQAFVTRSHDSNGPSFRRRVNTELVVKSWIDSRVFCKYYRPLEPQARMKSSPSFTVPPPPGPRPGPGVPARAALAAGPADSESAWPYRQGFGDTD